MERRTKQKTKEITKTILEILAVGSFVSVLGTLAHGRVAPKLVKGFVQYSSARIRETLKRLRLQDYIAYDPDDDKSPIVLTEKGMRRLCSSRFTSIFKERKQRWDYLWRVLIFDIPESRVRARKQLRQELLAAGFYPLQRSVFVCPYECSKEIVFLCDVLYVKPYVISFTAASLGEKEKEVRQFYFGHGKK